MKGKNLKNWSYYELIRVKSAIFTNLRVWNEIFVAFHWNVKIFHFFFLKKLPKIMNGLLYWWTSADKMW